MRVCGVMKIAAVLFVDFTLLYLGLGVIAAAVITTALVLAIKKAVYR